jgi:hypothetical protein
MGCFHSRERDIPSEDDSLWSDDDQDTGAAAEAPAEAAKVTEAPKETNEAAEAAEPTKVTEPQLA